MRATTTKATLALAVGALTAAGATPPYTVFFLVRGGSSRLDLVEEVAPDGGEQAYANGPVLGFEQWRSLTVTLERAPGRTLSISDGVGVHTLPVPAWPVTTKLAFKLGMVDVNPYSLEDARLQARYDAIRCDAP